MRVEKDPQYVKEDIEKAREMFLGKLVRFLGPVRETSRLGIEGWAANNQGLEKKPLLRLHALLNADRESTVWMVTDIKSIGDIKGENSHHHDHVAFRILHHTTEDTYDWWCTYDDAVFFQLEWELAA